MGLPVQQHYYLDADHLRSIALARGEDYRSSSPFPHAVIDDFLPEDVAHAAAAEFASLDASSWQLYSDSGNTTKLATSQECDMGPVLRHLSNQFNSQTFVLFLEQLTGIDGLVADPQLFGGGLHQLNPGGYLRVHADFNWHDGLHLDRRLNAILYLNPGWREEWGGAFEMWSTDMSSVRGQDRTRAQPARRLQHPEHVVPRQPGPRDVPAQPGTAFDGVLLLHERPPGRGAPRASFDPVPDPR